MGNVLVHFFWELKNSNFDWNRPLQQCVVIMHGCVTIAFFLFQSCSLILMEQRNIGRGPLAGSVEESPEEEEEALLVVCPLDKKRSSAHVWGECCYRTGTHTHSSTICPHLSHTQVQEWCTHHHHHHTRAEIRGRKSRRCLAKRGPFFRVVPPM